MDTMPGMLSTSTGGILTEQISVCWYTPQESPLTPNLAIWWDGEDQYTFCWTRSRLAGI